MTPKQLFHAYKITTAAGLHHKTGMSRQRCWYIWKWGAISASAAEIIHNKLGIPYELLMDVRNTGTRPEDL